MNKKRGFVVIVSLFFIVLAVVSSDNEQGCCINPYTTADICGNQISIDLCCPTDGTYNQLGGPANKADCDANFFKPNNNCAEIDNCTQGCCDGGSYVCDSGTLKLDCDIANAVFSALPSCETIPNCESGCCCSPGQEQLISRKQCTNQNGNFSPYVTKQSVCDTLCEQTKLFAQNIECQEINGPNVYCGNNLTNSTHTYCCAKDSRVTPSQLECQIKSCAISFTLNGTITSSTDNSPINNAQVIVEGQTETKSNTTNNNGFYLISDLSNGIYTVTASAPTFQQKQQQITISNSNQILDISLDIAENCTNSIDDDSDGANDICDTDCGLVTTNINDNEKQDSENTTELCNNGKDDDCNGVTDCFDPNCQPLLICQEQQCPNNIKDPGEDCDATYDTFGNKIGEGDDTACPGRCSSQCKCTPECGDGNCDEGETYLSCSQDCPTPIDIKICGNGLLDSENNEICDPTADITACNSNQYCVGPNLPLECTCISLYDCNDNNIINNYEECEPGRIDCSAGKICKGCPGKCVSDCLIEPAKPVLTFINFSYANNNPYIKIQFNNDCTPINSYIMKCVGPNESCINSEHFDQQFGPITTNEYNDFLITNNTNYCYKVKSFFEGGHSKISDEKLCFELGDKECLKQNTEEFCIDNIRYGCNEFGKRDILETCQEREVCMENIDSTTSCIKQAYCLNCSTPLGLYSSTNSKVNDPNDDRFTISCEFTPTCYLDTSYSVPDLYYECLNVKSCYDYNSKKACEQNKCRIQNCVWNPSFDELGAGVCSTTIEEEQQCHKCNGNFNSIFGDCNKQTCALYGECYYNSFTKICKHKSETTCTDFDSIQDCIGQSQINVNTNITWEIDESTQCINNGACLKPNNTHGSNKILTLSDDYFNFGRCKYVNNKCIKDADNIFYLTGRARTQKVDESDCYSKGIECYTDFETPNTTIIYTSPMGKDLSLTVSVRDNTYDNSYIKTYYTIKNSTELYQYPNKLVKNNKIELSLKHSDQYTLYFYSKDDAENYEEVKSISFYVDAELPQVNLTTLIIPKEITVAPGIPSQWLSNLNITLDVSDNMNGQVVCTGFLKLDGTIIQTYHNITNETGNKWNKLYQDLKDGYYAYTYECKDKRGNIANNTIPITISEDKNIYDTLPNTTLDYSGDVLISVKTLSNAKCRFSDSDLNYQDMTPFSQTGGLVHNSTEYIYDTTTYRKYYVKCNFTDRNFISEDQIRFFVDLIPPKVISNKNFDEWHLLDQYETLNVILKCVDVAITDENNVHHEFNDCKLHYRSGDEGSINSYNKNNVTITLTETTNLYYKATDQHNMGKLETKTVKIDKEDPKFTIKLTDDINQETDLLTICPGEDTALYHVYIQSTKPLNDTNPFLTLRFSTLYEQTNMYNFTRINSTYWSSRLILRRNEFNQTYANGSFEVRAVDYHGRTGNQILNDQKYLVDTKKPSIPIINYTLLGNFHNNIYYSNKSNIIISGTTEESDNTVSLYAGRSSTEFKQKYQQDNSNHYTFNLNLENNGLTNIAINAKDTAGNPSDLTGTKVFYDSTFPELAYIDPYEEEVISLDTKTLTIKFKKLKKASEINMSSIKILINEQPQTIDSLTETSDDNYNYYEININLVTFDEKQYNISFEVTDYALNKLSKEWYFTKNRTKDQKPTLQVTNSIFKDSTYFIKQTPTNNQLTFNSVVNLTNIYLGTQGSSITYQSDDNQTFYFNFSSEFEENDYILYVKTTNNLWHFHLNFDNSSQDFTIDHINESKQGQQILIKTITNEPYGGKAEITILNQKYLMDKVDSNLYYYDWNIPKTLEDGTYPINITFTDSLGNTKTKNTSILIYTWESEINITDFIVHPGYQYYILKEEPLTYKTNDRDITIKGFVSTDSSIESVYYKHGCKEEQTAVLDDNNHFNINIILSGIDGEETQTYVTLRAKKTSTQEINKTISVILDKKPPQVQQSIIE